MTYILIGGDTQQAEMGAILEIVEGRRRPGVTLVCIEFVPVTDDCAAPFRTSLRAVFERAVRM
jgi:hypothetical protein